MFALTGSEIADRRAAMNRACAIVMRMRMACIVCFALTACAAGGVLLCGSRFVLAVLPLRFVPALLLALFTLLADRIRARRAEGRGEA